MSETHQIPPNENAGDLLYKILEMMDIKILVEHPSLNTIMLLPTLGFVPLKHYVYGMLILHQVSI